MTDTQEIIKLLEKRLATFEDQKSSNVGTVEKNQDGVITASGLSKAMMGELVSFDKGNKGLVLNLDEETVSIILLDRAENIKEGDVVKTTGKLLSIEVSGNLLGRV
ncbi:MAG: F0F1 ATP synthase subunit alpha, partial [Candidatus Levybacteria bacterium]|nr:F0F1 ATP synthase subunit alpha [Candidatus Levybacteria bacterium]